VNGDALLGDTGTIAPPPSFVGSIDYSTRRIWTLGDSITYGVVVTPPGCAYRDGLSNQLMAAGFSGIQWVGSLQGGSLCQVCPLNGYQMFNDGHSGFTCNDIITILPGISANAQADVTLLMIGTNDMILVVEGTETIGAAIAAWNFLFAEMLSLQSSGAIFFVANLPPSPPLLGANMNSFNANIATQVAAAAAAGSLVFLVDIFDALDPATDFDVGGVHPLAAGYAKMATAWYDAMIAATP
jgi:GDSL-like Lipase/Acylhydrolase family